MPTPILMPKLGDIMTEITSSCHSGESRNPGQAWVMQKGTMKQPCVYLMASKRNGTLYVGVTSNLPQRVWQHKHGLVEGFTNRYHVHTLVWYEVHATMEAAVAREKALKEWKRAWKLELIEKSNPVWRDLGDEIL